MPIIARDSYRSRDAVTECRTTYVKAFGQATAEEKTATLALAAAKQEAYIQLAASIAVVKGLKCPQGTRECKGICERGRTRLRGIGSERSRRKRIAPKRWQVSFTAWRSYDVVCRCRR